MTTTYTIPLATVLEGFAVVAPFMASKSDAQGSPALGTVRLSPGELLATDRYAVGRYRRDTITADVEDAPPVLVPADAVAWLVGIKRATLRDGKNALTLRDHADDAYSVTITEEAGESGRPELTISLVSNTRGKVERSQAFDGRRLNFPSVEKLFPETLPDDPSGVPPIGAAQFERLAKVSKMFGKDVPVFLTPTAALAEQGRKNKPVHFHVYGAPLDGLIQPCLVRS